MGGHFGLFRIVSFNYHLFNMSIPRSPKVKSSVVYDTFPFSDVNKICVHGWSVITYTCRSFQKVPVALKKNSNISNSVLTRMKIPLAKVTIWGFEESVNATGTCCVRWDMHRGPFWFVALIYTHTHTQTNLDSQLIRSQ